MVLTGHTAPTQEGNPGTRKVILVRRGEFLHQDWEMVLLGHYWLCLYNIQTWRAKEGCSVHLVVCVPEIRPLGVPRYLVAASNRGRGPI